MNIATIMESSTSWEFKSSTTRASEARGTHLPLGVTSPSLYQVQDEEFAYDHDGMAVLASSLKLKPEKSNTSTTAETAAKLLPDLEGRGSMDSDGYNDFGQNWNEESLNLELFQELSDVGLQYSCPPSPVSDEFENQHQLAEFSDPAVLVEGMTGLATAEFPESSNQLSADFQLILDMLPEEGIVEINDAKICGASFIQLGEGQIIFAGENDHIFLTDDFKVESDIPETATSLKEEPENGGDNNSDDSNDMPTAENEDDDQSFASSTFTESELSACGISDSSNSLEQSQDILDLSLIKSDPDSDSDDDYVPSDEESDSEMEIETTISDEIVFVSRNAVQESRLYKMQNTQASSNSYISNSIRKQQKKQNKPLARTQKSEVGRKRKSSKDSARIKLQNRTAAARYRKKKKLESARAKEIEADIERENSALLKQSDDLKRNIILVKQLIHDVFKSKQSMSTSCPESRIRIRNRK